jgi:hypothetical protein
MSTLACDCMQKEKYATVSLQFHIHPDKRKLRFYCSRYSAGRYSAAGTVQGGIVTKLRPGQPRNFLSIPGKRKEIFSSQNAHTSGVPRGGGFKPPTPEILKL